MNITNIKDYVRLGCDPIPDKQEFRKNVRTPLWFTLILGLFPGFMLEGYWLLISCALILVNIISIKMVYTSSSFIITLERCLMLKFVINLAWVIELSLLELMYFSLMIGFHASVLLLYLPFVFVPLSIGFFFHRQMKKKENSKPKNSSPVIIGNLGFLAGILGVYLSKVFLRDADKGVVNVVLAVCVVLINSLISIGLLDIQKLYYVKKYNITFDASK